MQKLVFIHIPRTAGNSIIDAFDGHETLIIRHDLRAKEFKFYEKSVKDDSIVFTVVRNPIDRAHSAYNYLYHGGNNDLDAQDAYFLGLRTMTFNEFVINKLEDASRWQIHFIPQFKWVEKAIDLQVIRFENLNHNLTQFCMANNLVQKELTHLNKSLEMDYSRSDVCTEAVNIIKQVYEVDYQKFNYV